MKTMWMIGCAALLMSAVAFGGEDAPRHQAVVYSMNRHSYKIVKEQLTWEQARERCEQMGGHLVTVTSQNEGGFVRKLYKESGVTGFWMGAKAEKTGPFFTDKDFKWITGEPFHVKDTTGILDVRGRVCQLALFRNGDKVLCSNLGDGDGRVDAFMCEWEPAGK